jgi:8-oxo-dGTP diphosphatase
MGRTVYNDGMAHTYDYPRPSVTVDVIILTQEPRPKVLLIRRKKEPFAGTWAIPGGFVDPGETLAAAAERELREETGVTHVSLEQLAAFGDPGRDPRGWTVSVVFMACVPADTMATAADDAAEAGWHFLDDLPSPLAFDHDKILVRAKARLAAFAP